MSTFTGDRYTVHCFFIKACHNISGKESSLVKNSLLFFLRCIYFVCMSVLLAYIVVYLCVPTDCCEPSYGC